MVIVASRLNRQHVIQLAVGRREQHDTGAGRWGRQMGIGADCLGRLVPICAESRLQIPLDCLAVKTGGPEKAWGSQARGAPNGWPVSTVGCQSFGRAQRER